MPAVMPVIPAPTTIAFSGSRSSTGWFSSFNGGCIVRGRVSLISSSLVSVALTAGSFLSALKFASLVRSPWTSSRGDVAMAVGGIVAMGRLRSLAHDYGVIYCLNSS